MSQTERPPRPTDRPVVSTSRVERLAELQSRTERIRFRMRALYELADEIGRLQPRCQGYGPIWQKIADRVRIDAGSLERELDKAQERLAVLNAALDAAERYDGE